MSRKYKLGMALLACALAVAWLLPAPGLAFFDGEEALNVVSIGRTDRDDQRGVGKWGTWPKSDGKYLIAGCDAPDRCFMVYDLSDPTEPKVVKTVTVYGDNPSPPPGDDVWSQTTPVPGWDPAWNTQTHFVQSHGNILVINRPHIGKAIFQANDPVFQKFHHHVVSKIQVVVKGFYGEAFSFGQIKGIH